jgi:signal transduction histidine kinase
MRAGLRLQILVLLGGLLVASFVPLYMAVAGYTTLAFGQLGDRQARALGFAVARHASEVGTTRSSAELQELLRTYVGTNGIESIGVYAGRERRVVAHVGPQIPIERLPEDALTREGAFELELRKGRALAVVVPSREGAVIVGLSIDEPAARAAPLLRLLALYTGLVALALLVIAYFALTRLIVRPLDQLTRAAERVAGGARRLTLPATGVRELVELGTSLRSMTERLLAEEEALRRKIDEVEAVAARLKEAQHRLVRSERVASVGRLAAGLAHEVGNPISALIGLQDLLLEGGLEPEEQRDFLKRMRRETERIHVILRDLLQFARARPATAPPEPGDVAGAVMDTATLVAPQKAMKDVALALDLEQDLPRVTLSREQIVQVVLNLVLNAADAVSPGGNVIVRARALQNGVELSVEDDGPGVSAQVRDQLFEPFVTTKEVGKGTGLGLAVCRGLVEAVGGSIALDERYAGGARFVVELPAEKSGHASRAAPPV